MILTLMPLQPPCFLAEAIESLARRSETKMVGCKPKSQTFNQLINYAIVIAAQSIANIIKSSLGPLGLDKMLVDNIGVSRASCPRRLLRDDIPSFLSLRLGSNYLQ